MFKKRKNTELKRWHIILLAVIIVSAAVYKIYTLPWPRATATVAGQTFKVLVADTSARVREGWSNKDNMGAVGGMLFIFPFKEQHTMWMINMRFPIDIIWLDGSVVVDIAPNVAPEPGKTPAQLTRYSARLPSTGVLELPAGFTQKYGLKVGDRVVIRK